MTAQVLAILLGVAFAALLLWLLLPRRRSAESSGPAIDRAMGNAFPKHYRYFPQIRQALSARDNQYLREVAPAAYRATSASGTSGGGAEIFSRACVKTIRASSAWREWSRHCLRCLAASKKRNESF